jgi:hypothetical protein
VQLKFDPKKPQLKRKKNKLFFLFFFFFFNNSSKMTSSTTTTTTIVVNASDTTLSATSPPGTLCELNDGDTAFVVVGAVMILGMMTNLAFFTAGLLRSNNTLSILMAHISSMVACSVLWLLFGYSLAFGTDHGECKESQSAKANTKKNTKAIALVSSSKKSDNVPGSRNNSQIFILTQEVSLVDSILHFSSMSAILNAIPPTPPPFRTRPLPSFR